MPLCGERDPEPLPDAVDHEPLEEFEDVHHPDASPILHRDDPGDLPLHLFILEKLLPRETEAVEAGGAGTTISSIPCFSAVARIRAGKASESSRFRLWAAVEPQQFQSRTSSSRSPSPGKRPAAIRRIRARTPSGNSPDKSRPSRGWLLSVQRPGENPAHPSPLADPFGNEMEFAPDVHRGASSTSWKRWRERALYPMISPTSYKRPKRRRIESRKER